MLLGGRGRLTSVPWHNPHSAIHLTEAMQIHTHCPGYHLPLNPRPHRSQSATDLGQLCPQKNPESLAAHPPSSWPSAHGSQGASETQVESMQTLRWELPASRGATTPLITSCPLATPAQHSSASPHFLHISVQSHLPGVSDNPPPKRSVLTPSLSISLLSPGGKGAP